MKRGVCIVECIDADDPGSEGRVLKEIFNLMEVESKLVRANSITELLETVAESKFRHVHVSTHGALTDDNKFKGWWTPKGSGTRRRVEMYDIRLPCISIVSTACRSGAKGFAKHVTENWGCRRYIAPLGSPSFYDAVLFSHIYYHKLFKTRRTVDGAFASYDDHYKNPHGFTLYAKTRSAIRSRRGC